MHWECNCGTFARMQHHPTLNCEPQGEELCIVPGGTARCVDSQHWLGSDVRSGGVKCFKHHLNPAVTPTQKRCRHTCVIFSRLTVGLRGVSVSNMQPTSSAGLTRSSLKNRWNHIFSIACQSVTRPWCSGYWKTRMSRSRVSVVIPRDATCRAWRSPRHPRKSRCLGSRRWEPRIEDTPQHLRTAPGITRVTAWSGS